MTENNAPREVTCDDFPEELPWACVATKIANGEPVGKREFATAATHIADSIIFHDYLYGETEALAGRVVWVFPDGTVFWYAGSDDFFCLSHLEKEYSEDSEPPIDFEKLLGTSDVEWMPSSNGWYIDEFDNVDVIVDRMAEDLGEPVMYLPWQSMAENWVMDDDEDYFLEEMSTEPEEMSEAESLAYKSLFTLFKMIATNDESIAGENLWAVKYASGYDLMPNFSAAARFNKFLGALDEDHGWIVIFDECCGSCSRGSIEAEQRDEAKKDAPIFITWGQNAEGAWTTDGSISHLHYAEIETIEFLRETASQYGLTLEEREEDSDMNSGYRFVTIRG